MKAVYYTNKQLEIMEFLQQFRRHRQLSPTLEEMAENFHVSRVTIHEHIKELARKGALQSVPYKARSIEILDPQFADEPVRSKEQESDLQRVPVEILGRIAAGEPIEAVEAPERVDLADLLPMGRDHYALRVRGTSMIDEGIHDGDMVLVERREVADDGELVVAILEQEGIEGATLKKFFHHSGEGGKKQFRLQPANQELEPIIVDQLEIRGVVVGVVRRYPRWAE